MVYHFKIHKEVNGLWAECLELSGCVTQGNSFKEPTVNAEEALNLFLSEPEDSKVKFALPKEYPNRKNILAVQVDPRIALAMTLRQSRKRRGLTQKRAAEIMGYKSIFAYQKLESPETCNPELTTLYQLKKHIDIDLEEVLSSNG